MLLAESTFIVAIKRGYSQCVLLLPSFQKEGISVSKFILVRSLKSSLCCRDLGALRSLLLCILPLKVKLPQSQALIRFTLQPKAPSWAGDRTPQDRSHSSGPKAGVFLEIPGGLACP